MLTVTFDYDERGFPISVTARGHAGWAELGKDVVCAAVSVLLQSTWLGITEVACISVEGHRDSGLLEMRWSDRESAALSVLLQTADLSIAQLARQYPKHIRYERRCR
jgi:uncharacterized protein YsxB (DUF464 family)